MALQVLVALALVAVPVMGLSQEAQPSSFVWSGPPTVLNDSLLLSTQRSGSATECASGSIFTFSLKSIGPLLSPDPISIFLNGDTLLGSLKPRSEAIDGESLTTEWSDTIRVRGNDFPSHSQQHLLAKLVYKAHVNQVSPILVTSLAIQQECAVVHCEVSNCQECTLSTRCSLCQEGFFSVSPSQCSAVCPDSTTANSETRVCEPLSTHGSHFMSPVSEQQHSVFVFFSSRKCGQRRSHSSLQIIFSKHSARKRLLASPVNATSSEPSCPACHTA
eukprot:m.109841 g.109841  ORF g.109841 m.109841 type:complete len:275 (+) comp14319_c1_seq4:16-840(+)